MRVRRPAAIDKRYPFKPRLYYAGEHALEPQINGRSTFTLTSEGTR